MHHCCFKIKKEIQIEIFTWVPTVYWLRILMHVCCSICTLALGSSINGAEESYLVSMTLFRI